jgi:hypothetical protein
MDHQDSTDDRFLALRIAKLELTPLEETRKAGESQPRAAGTGAGLFDQRAALQDMASLGSNCEFGFVQRFVGAEPMSLFRWTSAPAAKLIKALRRRFAGLDARDALNIEVNSDGEFVVEDKVYGFRHHTFVSEFDGATLERVGRNEYIRVGVLTKTLIEELREQKKLFVYHDAGESDVTVIRRLVRALKSYGDNTLLWIVAAPDPSLIGAAKLIEPGLIQGFVSGFQSGVIKDVSPHLPSWLAAAHEAHRIWCATRETQAKMRLARQTKGART